MTEEQRNFSEAMKPNSRPTTIHYPYTFSPVTVTETVGTAFLGILSMTLMVTLLFVLARNRKLERLLTHQTSTT